MVTDVVYIDRKQLFWVCVVNTTETIMLYVLYHKQSYISWLLRLRVKEK